MIEIQIPKDIRKYEAKLIGPFTLRQLICFILGCIVAYVVYTLMSKINLSEDAMPIAMVSCAPVLAFGWIKPYGMPLEKFLQTALISTLLAPTERKYKTKNNFKITTDDHKKINQSEYKKRLKKDKKLAKTDSKYESFK